MYGIGFKYEEMNIEGRFWEEMQLQCGNQV
jgi:hypothetical protein